MRRLGTAFWGPDETPSWEISLGRLLSGAGDAASAPWLVNGLRKWRREKALAKAEVPKRAQRRGFGSG